MSDYLDGDGYPTDEACDKVEKWDFRDFEGMLDFVKSMWMYADCGYWRETQRRYYISTAGWSGNESLMAAMRRNMIFWSCYWIQSSRGGHYVFDKTRFRK